jgi:hypothetical protein
MLDLTCQEADCEPCHSFYDVVGDVVAVGYQAVCAVLGETGCDGLTAYVSVGEPSLPTGEYLGGWLIEMIPYNPASSKAAALGMVPRLLATVGLKLLEAGYPQLGQTGPTDLPDPKDTIVASYHSMGHHEAITRSLMRAVATRQLGTDTGCVFMGLGRSRPVSPSAGLVGWTWEVQVEVQI